RYIGELLDLCIYEGGPDGLDTAIDVLSETGNFTLDCVYQFIRKDFKNWAEESRCGGQSVDDVWYVLARALAKSDLDHESVTLPILTLGLRFVTANIREATTHALGAVGGELAINLLKE